MNFGGLDLLELELDFGIVFGRLVVCFGRERAGKWRLRRLEEERR